MGSEEVVRELRRSRGLDAAGLNDRIGAEDAVVAQMIHDGEFVEAHHVSRGHTRFVIRLLEPLGLGQRHEYSIQVRLQWSTRDRSKRSNSMAPVEKCPTCKTVMYADVEKYMEKGTDVTYVCRNNQCPTYVKSGNKYPEKLKKFVSNPR